MGIFWIVMAAGSGVRFGGQKLLASFEGRPLISYVLQTLGQVKQLRHQDEVIVVTGDDTVADLAKQQGFAVVANQSPELGQSETIRLALKYILGCKKYASEPYGLGFVVGDQPLLKASDLMQMGDNFAKANDAKAILAAADGQGNLGNPVIFGNAYESELAGMVGDQGGKIVLRCHQSHVVKYEMASYLLQDIDVVADLTKIAQRQGQSSDE